MSVEKHSILYARMSRGTASNEPTVEYQVQVLLAAAKADGEIVDPDRDIYVEGMGAHSGRSLRRRPKMRQALERLEHDRDIASFRAYDLERVSREAEFTLSFHKLLKRRGIRFVLARDPLPSDDSAVLRASLGLRAIMAQFYADNVSDRLRDYYALARRNHWNYAHKAVPGLKLIGSKESRHYVISDEGVWLVKGFVVAGNRNDPPFALRPSPPEFHSYFDSVRIAFQIVCREDKSEFLVAAQLHALNFFRRDVHGVPRLVNQFDVRDFKSRRARYRDFLPDPLMQLLEFRIAAHSTGKANGRRMFHSPPVLWRLLYCSECGKRYRVSHESGSRKTTASCYRHDNIACMHRRRIAAHKLEFQLWDYLERALRLPDNFADLIAERSSLPAAPAQAQPASSRVADPATSAREKLERRLKNLQIALVDEDISKEQFRALRREIETELESLNAQPPPPPQISFEDALALARDLASAMKDRHAADPTHVNLMLRGLFERILVHPDRTLEFIPQPWAKPFLGLDGKV